MTTFLLANIGNRDVGVDRAAPIPGEVHPQWNHEASRRALGETLLQDWPACQPHLSLPIIGKAVDYVRQQAGPLDHVILVVSDQSREKGVAAHHLAQDTCTLAPVVARLLAESYGLPAAAITHWTVRGNPADYGVMQSFFRQRLAALRAEHPGATYYLEVSGGTPAMTSMLLTVGAEVLGLAARPLYVSEHADQPFPLDLGRRLVAQALLETMRADLDIYAYHAAARTICDNRDLLGEFVPAERLEAILEYAHQRLNFNFDRARAALAELPGGDWAGLAASLHEDRSEWLLHEIIYNTEIKLRTGAYGDLLTRVFRFDEAALRHTACQLGAQLVDKKNQPDPDGEFVDPAWLATQPDLAAYLDGKTARRDGEGRIGANRMVLAWLVAFLADQQGDPAPRALLKQLGQIGKLSDVRNQSFAVHSFRGVSRQRMAQAFIGPEASGTDDEMAQIMTVLRDACALATSQPFDPANPYTALNHLAQDLLAA